MQSNGSPDSIQHPDCCAVWKEWTASGLPENERQSVKLIELVRDSDTT